ncbi:MAG: universal stress protein [Deltaproteobacteria bacterium]|nr:universal stress protein [Deltaproteobacteria bacterium]
MQNINRILVVSRMTTSSITAVHYGVSLAKKYGAMLYVIHVIHDPFSLEGWNLPLPNLEKDYQNLLKKMKQQLNDIIKNENQDGLQIEVLMPEGDPTEEIMKTVKEKNIDLLVMLAHEEGHLEHLLFGRSNKKLLMMMPCSILLVKKEPEPCINKPFCN